MKKRIEVTIETERLLIARNRKFATIWCDDCSSLVKMITVDEAAVLAQQTERTIYGWVEAGSLHFSETSEGRLFICLNSIP